MRAATTKKVLIFNSRAEPSPRSDFVSYSPENSVWKGVSTKGGKGEGGTHLPRLYIISADTSILGRADHYARLPSPLSFYLAAPALTRHRCDRTSIFFFIKRDWSVGRRILMRLVRENRVSHVWEGDYKRSSFSIKYFTTTENELRSYWAAFFGMRYYRASSSKCCW